MTAIKLLILLLASTFQIIVSSDERNSNCVSNAGNISASTITPPPKSNKQKVLEAILSQNTSEIDPSITPILQELKNRNAHKCWHKHSTFYHHLTSVYSILSLWNQAKTLSMVGLLHSAYSNSYVNLALFDPQTERNVMQNLVHKETEEEIYLFCSINRQEIVVDTLLKQGFIPTNGMTVQHLRLQDTQVHLSSNYLKDLIIFTMADIADQYFGWQDDLFDEGMLRPKFQMSMNSKTLWPGVSKPGLWVAYVSELGRVASTLNSLNLPPVFENCTKILTRENEVLARDIYWNIINEEITLEEEEEVISSLINCTTLNPFIAEPYVLLAQKYLHSSQFNNAKDCSLKAIELFTDWGIAWDKRMSFGAWFAWSKVLLQKSTEQLPWPENSWEINNLGFVLD